MFLDNSLTVTCNLEVIPRIFIDNLISIYKGPFKVRSCTSKFSITWKFVINANTQAPLQIYCTCPAIF